MKKTLTAFFVALATLLPSIAFAHETVKIHHTVTPGESLWEISQRHQTTPAEIKKMNKMRDSMIYPGQQLYIHNKPVVYHNVAAGDSLWKIASKYNAIIHEIALVNKLSSTRIYPNQLLRIPVNSESSKYTPAEIELLARLVRAEAQGESYMGKVAVAAVVLNRVDHKSYPNTITNVIYETYENGRYYAFSPVMNGEIYRPADADSIRAVRDAISGYDPTYGSIFFYNPKTASSNYVATRTVMTRIGNHIFAK